MTDPRSRDRFWRWTEVQRWWQDVLGEPLTDLDLDGFEALNASLELRRFAGKLPEATRHRLLDLVA